MSGVIPQAETQFLDASGQPLVAGTVGHYIPNTFTTKLTWQDQAGTIPNSNPVVLDGGGRALIFGSGLYRQVVKDSLGNVIWDRDVGVANVDFGIGRAISVPTIDDLRSLSISTASSNFSAVVSEHTALTGVGGGLFRWDTASTLPDDNGIVINLIGNSGPGRFVRIFDGPAELTFWGADPSGVALSDTAFVSFRDYVVAGRDGRVPLGQFDISTPITIPGSTGGWRLEGASRTGTVINQRTNNTPCFTFVGDLTNNFQLGRFTLSHTSAQTDPTQPGCGIYYDLPGTTGNGIFNAHYFDIFFVKCGRGFMSNPSKSFPVWGSVFERIYTQRGCTGALFYFRPSPSQGQPNNCFRDVYVFANNVLASEFALIDTNTQDTVEIHNCEINEAQLGAKVMRVTESIGTIGAIKLETATYSQGGSVQLCDFSNSNFEVGSMLFAVSDVTNSTNLICVGSAGGVAMNLGIGSFNYGFTFSRTAPTSGTFRAFNATAADRIRCRRINDPRAAGYATSVSLLDNTSSNTASGVSILNMLDPKISADVGDADYTVAAYSKDTIINYQSARTANRTVTLPSTGSDDLFNGLSYTILVGTASAFTIDVGGVFTFPASKTGSVTVTYRRFAWVVTQSFSV